MLEQARPDALWICVPPHLQTDVLLQAVQRGIPFFVDPPGAVDYPRGCLYGRAVAKANLITAVGFAARSTDVVQEGREYLGANRGPLALGWSLNFGEQLSSLALAERDKTTILRCLNVPAADQALAFLEAVATGSPARVPVSYGEALKTLAVCHAAAVSAREGRPVAIEEIE